MILHHSVLVRSERCQIGCHGETRAYVTAADVRASDWSPECGRVRWDRLVASSVISAGDAKEDGRE